jgi:hypothetical protein
LISDLTDCKMEYGVAVLLDALGTRKNYEYKSIHEIKSRWNEIDEFCERSCGILAKRLKSQGYRHDVALQTPYDNFQIFVPVDDPSPPSTAINLSNTTSIWWTVIELAELLIPLLRKALINKIFLRGCICAGKYFQTRKRIFGYPIDEAVENYEQTEWIGIIAAYSSNLILNVGSASNASSIFNYLVEYDVPLKNNVTKRLRALDWTRNRPNMYDNIQIDHEHILNVIKTEVCNARDNSIKKKCQNTLDFYNQFHT